MLGFLQRSVSNYHTAYEKAGQRTSLRNPKRGSLSLLYQSQNSVLLTCVVMNIGCEATGELVT